MRCGDGDIVKDGVDYDVGKVLLLVEREAELVVVVFLIDYLYQILGFG